MDLSLVIPVYNEVDNVRPLMDEIDSVLGPSGLSYEVVAVDDGSRDGTRDKLRELAAERKHLKVIFFRRNCGQTAAFDAGFRHASGRVVATMDADMQNDPRDIPALVKKLDEGFDVVTGWRKKRQDAMIVRKIPSKIANWLIRKVTKTKVHDLGCSLKVYKREITDELRLYGEMHRFLVVLTEMQGARVGELEVNHRARHAGVSKYGLSRVVKVLLDLLTVWFIRNYQTKPLYFFGGVGFVMVAVSALVSLVVLYEKFLVEPTVWVHRNPLFSISITLALVGVTFIGLGLLAEIIVRTYFESQNKPTYPVSERLNFTSPSESQRPRAAAE